MTIVLITGATRGIGRAVAVRLAARPGFQVLVAGRDPARCAEVAAAIGPNARPVPLDVTDQTADMVLRELPALDVLINNAGISGTVLPPSTSDVAEAERVFATNYFGVLRVTNAVLPLLRRSPAGRIVNVSSSVGSLTRMSDPAHYFARLPALASYPPSKAALNMLTVQYAKELRPDGILVNAADPGACDTGFTRGLGPTPPRSADDGAAIVAHLATLPADGPTGGLFNDDGPVPW
jgi:NAD(P)-dependent dehydrogenase (short-subunit alcohol dehydrogenase family)